MKKYMRSVAVTDKGVVKLVDDVPIPIPSEYEALVKVKTCGICNGTDFQVINGTLGKQSPLGKYPTLLGHEGCGDVVKIGSKVRYIQISDRFIHPNLHEDVGNGYSRTWGGMSEYGLVADHKAMLEDGYSRKDLPFVNKFAQVPKDFDYLNGSMLLSLSESYSAARNFGADSTKDVLIYGAGPMGIALAKYMMVIGVKSLTVIDGISDRLEMVKRIAGVDKTLDFNVQDIESELKDQEFDIVVDAVGLTSVILDGARRLRPFGRVGMMGVLKSYDSMIDAQKLKPNIILHMLNFPYGEYSIIPENIDLIQKGIINPKDFYSHVLPIKRLHEGLELVKSKQAFKVILDLEA